MKQVIINVPDDASYLSFVTMAVRGSTNTGVNLWTHIEQLPIDSEITEITVGRSEDKEDEY